MSVSGITAKGGTYQMDRVGASNILKTSSVKDKLQSIIDDLCNEANKMEAVRQDGHQGYKTSVHVLSWTAIGEVYTASDAAANDNATYHTLNALLH
ncbi:MAG: hypothetical protein LUC17_02675 [Oscillospiraceae bacterium]|nr:hypothetical protein [Oscillospiraceae bacterium]